ncbi:MAG: hypothetical protein OTJ97_08025 [SAR202 cluster bacterium]|nr:hypothetical protein [SAR202 cluster bacterium]
MVAYYQESTPNYLRIIKFAGLGISLTLLTVVVFFASAFQWLMVSTADAASSADAFLETLGGPNNAQSYALTSARFQEEQDPSRFASELEAIGSLNFELLPVWRRTMPNNGAMGLKGTVQTESGTVFPFVIEMVNEDGWKVNVVTNRMTGAIGPGAWFTGVPSAPRVLQFVKDTMADLGPAIMQDDFVAFVDSLPDTVIEEVASSSLKTTFDQIVGQIDLSRIADVEPVLDPPAWELITSCGSFGGGCSTTGVGTRLMATGYYPLEPEPFHFKLIYAYNHPDWLIDCSFEQNCALSIGSGEGR